MTKKGPRGAAPTDGILRRDFLQGAGAGTLAATMMSLPQALSAQTPASQAPASLPPHPGEPGGYYPPIRTGMRGAHPGAFEIAHALRDGDEVGQSLAGAAQETYDLVVVGGGISGLSAARFYADRNPAARILILENHDDFGGHAKRNEVPLPSGRPERRIALMNGGTMSIESPRPYGPVAEGLLRRLGIDTPALIKAHGGTRGPALTAANLTPAIFFERARFGADHLARTPADMPLAEALAHAPLSPTAHAQISALEAGHTDTLAHLAPEPRKYYLSTLSYRDYLAKHGRLGDEALALYLDAPLGWWCVGADGITALDAWAMGFPGFAALALPQGAIAHMGYTPRGVAETGGSPDFHFPDGNATIARLLVAGLIPGFLPKDITAENVVLAQAQYAALDREGQSVRLRLSSTVLRVANRPAGALVVYAQAGPGGPVLRKIAARHVVMACWNMIIPYIIPDLPEPQKAALHELVKEPLVYVSILLHNWRAFAKAGVSDIRFPGGWYFAASLDHTVEIGGYRGPSSPDDPIVLHMERIPHTPGLPEHDQNRAGRYDLLQTDFATFEQHIVAQLTAALGPYGFDATKDIAAITVNRWPHGYAPEYNPLWDKVPDGPDAPNIIGRQRFGAIAIANSDAGRAAYTDIAIEQAWRAVGDLLG